MAQLVPFDQIRDRIVVLRSHRVMLSGDLAELYGVEAKALVQAVKRNVARFPTDFMFGDARRVVASKVTKCDLRRSGPRRRSRAIRKVPSPGLHRARRRNAVERAEEQ